MFYNLAIVNWLRNIRSTECDWRPTYICMCIYTYICMWLCVHTFENESGIIANLHIHKRELNSIRLSVNLKN